MTPGELKRSNDKLKAEIDRRKAQFADLYKENQRLVVKSKREVDMRLEMHLRMERMMQEIERLNQELSKHDKEAKDIQPADPL